MKALFRKLVVCGCGVVGIHLNKTHDKELKRIDFMLLALYTIYRTRSDRNHCLEK
jgi:hypothetical protein